MRFYKTIENGYIIMVSTNGGEIEITESEYNKILELIKNKPKAEKGYDYKLKEDLTWEAILEEIVEEVE